VYRLPGDQTLGCLLQGNEMSLTEKYAEGSEDNRLLRHGIC